MLQIHAIPAFDDNYFWLIQPNDQDTTAYIVDPGAASPVFDALKQHHLTLKGILITHHHHDHKDGAEELSKHFNIPIYGPRSAKIPQITHYVSEGDQLQLGSLTAQVITLSGHTLDHIGYLITKPDGQQLLFNGDTLFSAGCGRLFDGSAEQLYHSIQRIAQLADDTLIYCAHEYTLANIEFALHIDPNNSDLRARQILEKQKRENNIATTPSFLSLEKHTNPYLRCHLPHIKSRIEDLSMRTLLTDIETFTQLRLLKDKF